MPGVILAAANLAPELCVAAFAGDPDAQVALNDAHAVTRRRPPHGLKQAVADRFGVSPSFRIG